jgi:hypothetical protein
MGWATFWATFSQTHLVTLLESNNCLCVPKILLRSRVAKDPPPKKKQQEKTTIDFEKYNSGVFFCQTCLFGYPNFGYWHFVVLLSEKCN